MEALGHRPVADALLEFPARHAAPQADVELRVLRGLGEIPHLRLRFAAHRRRLGHGGMDLERQVLLGIEDLHQQWKGLRLRGHVAIDADGVFLQQPAERLAGERAVRDHADIAGAVGDFPRLANGHAGWELLLVKRLQLATAPDAFLEDGLEEDRVEHELLNSQSRTKP